MYNCLELSCVELDLDILSNSQAFTAIEVTREKRKKKSTLQLLSASGHPQGDVSKPLRNQQITVLEQTKSRYFSGYTWKQQETTA